MSPIEAPHRRRFPRISARILILLCVVATVVMFVLTRSKGPLTSDERRMLGAWQWEDSQGTPNTLVMYLRADRRMRYLYLPFTQASTDHWHIEDGEITFVRALGRPIDRIANFVTRQKQVYPIRFEDDAVYMTMPDGKERRLIRYDDPVPESLTSPDE